MENAPLKTTSQPTADQELPTTETSQEQIITTETDQNEFKSSEKTPETNGILLLILFTEQFKCKY